MPKLDFETDVQPNTLPEKKSNKHAICDGKLPPHVAAAPPWTAGTSTGDENKNKNKQNVTFKQSIDNKILRPIEWCNQNGSNQNID